MMITLNFFFFFFYIITCSLDLECSPKTHVLKAQSQYMPCSEVRFGGSDWIMRVLTLSTNYPLDRVMAEWITGGNGKFRRWESS